MKLNTIKLSLLASLTLMLPQAANALERLPASLARITAQQSMQAVSIHDDQLEPHITFSSQPVHAKSLHLPGEVYGDSHVYAELDRASGKVTFRVWNELVNSEAHREFRRVHFVAGGQHRAQDLTIARAWTDNCVTDDTSTRCDQRIRVAFDVPEQVLREVAASYRADANAPWRYRLKDAHGRDVTAALAPAEVAGLLAAVDAYRGGTAIKQG